jgi:hypothetical protein
MRETARAGQTINTPSIDTGTSTGVAWTWLIALVGAQALWIDSSRFHAFHNADSLVPILVSLQHWTPFYWGQDRFGMLVPLLSFPIRSPFANLLVQNALTILSGLIAPFVIARYFVADRRWIAVGALASTTMLLLAAPFVFDWLATQPYALSLALAFAALLAAERPGIAPAIAATLLMLLACWSNLAVFVSVAPCLAWRPQMRKVWITAAGAAGGFVLREAAATGRTDLGILPMREWARSWLTFASELLWVTDYGVLFVVTGGIAAVIGVALWRRGRDRRDVQAAVVALAAAVISALAFGVSGHVRINGYGSRYALTSMLFAGTSVSILLTAWIDRRFWRTTATAAALGLAIVTGLTYGPPRPAQVRKTLDRRLGLLTPEVMNTGAAVVAGDYWTVWPAVFHANLTLADRPDRRAIYGFAFRSEATNDLWPRPQGAPALVLVRHSEAGVLAADLASIGRRIVATESRGSFDILTVSDALERDP